MLQIDNKQLTTELDDLDEFCLCKDSHSTGGCLLYLPFIVIISAPGAISFDNSHTHTRLTALCPGLPGRASTRKVKPIWILLKQKTVSGSGIWWAICKSAPRSRQITMPALHHSVFYRPDALPAAQPTASKHRRPSFNNSQ